MAASRISSFSAPMTSEVMQQAMALLDEEIGGNELLMSVAPIRLISVGGSLAVCVLGNRQSSYDIDCVLDPNVAAVQDYADEFKETVLSVADKGGFSADWLNRQLETFISRTRRNALFLESVEQGIIIYPGENVLVFAGRLDWALERKMRRIAHSPDRRGGKDVDITDAAAIIRYMIGDDKKPLGFEYIRSLNYNGFDVRPTDAAMREVARFYMQTYGTVGLAAEVVLDSDRKRWKYKADVYDNEWVWCS